MTPFGDWLEQLIAESTGKEGEGILPVTGEEIGPPEVYRDDRLFCAIRIAGDTADDEPLQALAEEGYPVITVELNDPYDLGGQCFFWEMATAAACWRLAVNPFDQPDVEAAKILARKTIAEFGEQGAMPPEKPFLMVPGLSFYGAIPAERPEQVLPMVLIQAKVDGYVAFQAYLPPSPETDEALQRLRMRIRDLLGLTATVGYGPRFLHSTGQLHKGDAGRGLCIQFTADDPQDAPIPDELGSSESAITFGVLKQAQAFGDRQALLDAGRLAIRIHLHKNPAEGILRLAATL